MAGSRRNPAKTENREWIAGQAIVRANHLFGRIYDIRVIDGKDDTRIPRGTWATVSQTGTILCNTRIKGTAEEWAYVITHCITHLCFGHLDRPAGIDERIWNYACDAFVERFLRDFKVGSAPADYRVDYPTYGSDERALAEEVKLRGTLPADYTPDMLFEKLNYWSPPNFQAAFSQALRKAVTASVRIAAGIPAESAWRDTVDGSQASQARSWLMANYPLIGAVLAPFRIIEDLDACRALDIQVAAVISAEKEIYINPLANLSLSEMRFVLAHEVLHAALLHDQRQETRDPFLWNIATDYAINLWLVEMQLGSMPRGLLLDQELKGLSAEEIYDRIAGDLRIKRKLAKAGTFAGPGKPDMIGRKPPEWWLRGEGVTLDEFYRSALAQGLELQLAEHGRGYLPAGLIEEIRAQLMPPIPWDVKLAQWLDQFFPIPEYRRSYARPSRRQSATPNIPRPNVIAAEGWDEARTFGAVIDTSGSMSRATLARALGSIASYCASREIPAARVVFCDAIAYDAGYMPVEEISGRVTVKGRGGTVLQPGIDLLQRAADFPSDGPILVITDALCESTLSVDRDHAFLVPYGRRLPFPPRGPVFTMPPDKSEGGW